MFVAGCLIWLMAPNPVGARVIMGNQQAYFRLRPADPRFTVPTYRNNGYDQSVMRAEGEYTVRVLVRNSPLSSKASPREVPRLDRRLAGLERELRRGDHLCLTDQVAAMFAWLNREILPEKGFIADQSLEKVLRTGHANCDGLSGLALHVLACLGVEARAVTGMAFTHRDPVSQRLEGNVLHRWIEIRYPDVGWVFADPAGKVNFVEATYLILGVAGVHPTAYLEQGWGTQVELLGLKNGFRSVGHIHGLDHGLWLRPNRLFVNP